MTDPLADRDYCDIITALSADQMLAALCAISTYDPAAFRNGIAYAMRSEARIAQHRAKREVSA